jgi:molybdopterin synthase catalytic subunit
MKIISVTGYKKSGKSLLIEKLISELIKRGHVGTIKHIHNTDLNPKGTDTRRHMDSGADKAIGVTSTGAAVYSSNTTLEHALDELANAGMDYTVVEGFKDSHLPRIVMGDLELPYTVKKLSTGPNGITDATITELLNIIEQQPEYYTLDSLIVYMKRHPRINEAGAIGSFTGIVRQKTGEIETKALEFESYEGMAKQKLQQLENDIKERKGIIDIKIYHKTGWVMPGEDIVHIVVAASHRQQLFLALSDAIERIKTEIPIWKKEHTTTGEFWVEGHL